MPPEIESSNFIRMTCGLAKTDFVESTHRMPWFSLPAQSSRKCRWFILKRLFEQKRISYLDYALTLQLLDNQENVREESAIFLCHLILAAKAGHLCVYLNAEELYPTVAQLWQDEEGNALPYDETQVLLQQMRIGALQIPASIVTRVDNNSRHLPELMPHTPICQDGERFYLQKYWVFETTFLCSLEKHLNVSPSIIINEEKITSLIHQLCHDNILLEEQALAILQGCRHSLTLITGGPGTGKTYTAGHLINTFWGLLSSEQKKSCQIILAAPTGKAAANLKRSLNRVISPLNDFPEIQAKTLHALLGVKQGVVHSHHDIHRLTADLIVVDECSMIDVRMMAVLFSSLKPGSRLVLLGDKNQLPAVEAGSVFSDLIQQNNIPVISLSRCLRAELQSLIAFAEYVKEGAAEKALDYLNYSSEKGVRRLKFSSDSKDSQKEFLNHVFSCFPAVINPKSSPSQLLEMFNSIRLLSPIRLGLFGFDSLNQLIWDKMSRRAPAHGAIAIPIIIATNDYRQELFNGETGLLIRKLPLQSIGIEDYALFPGRQEEGEVRRFSALLLPKYTLAYCLSVHKSQGSEFDRVILALPEGSELFGREVFYTAITRARKSIEIYGTDDVIRKTIQQQGHRLSGIGERLSSHKFSE